MATTLETERLILRDWRDEDRDPFAALNADPRVMEHYPATLTREESDGFIDRAIAFIAEHEWGLWAVERRADGRFIGSVGLWAIPWEAHFTPAVEVGWRLAFAAWGNGYATEAAAASIAHGFGPLGLDEIVSMTVPANVRSRAVMERLGLTHDPAEDFDHPRLPVGHPLRRHVLYRIHRTRWLELRLRPSCVQEVGYRGHSKKCGEQARYGLVERDGSGIPSPMCEPHALVCMDRTGARIAVTYRSRAES